MRCMFRTPQQWPPSSRRRHRCCKRRKRPRNSRMTSRRELWKRFGTFPPTCSRRQPTTVCAQKYATNGGGGRLPSLANDESDDSSSVPPRRRPPARARDRGDQDRSMRPALASALRAVDRHAPARGSRSRVPLQRCGPGAQAERVHGLLQRRSRASGARRRYPDGTARHALPRSCDAGPRRLQGALPRPVSDPDRCMTTNSPPTGG